MKSSTRIRLYGLGAFVALVVPLALIIWGVWIVGGTGFALIITGVGFFTLVMGTLAIIMVFSDLFADAEWEDYKSSKGK